MTIIIIVLHVIICAALIGLVLIQRGRGSGLVESFSGVESMFGTKTPAFLTRATTVLSVAFFITCLALALLSVRQSRSLLRDVQPSQKQEQVPLAPMPAPAQAPQTPQAPQAPQTPTTP